MTWQNKNHMFQHVLNITKGSHRGPMYCASQEGPTFKQFAHSLQEAAINPSSYDCDNLGSWNSVECHCFLNRPTMLTQL